MCAPTNMQVIISIYLQLNNCVFSTIYINVPDNTTRSCRVRPLLAKFCMSWVKLKLGPGILAKASLLFDTVPSLLPVSTSHIGLSNCKIEEILRLNFVV